MCVVRYWLDCLRGPMTLERRALWLQGSAQAILKVLDIKTQVEGQPPMCGLVVSNHLSYLDIIIISATVPCFFVAKMEIGSWPFFGRAARSGGTIFLDRSSLESAMTVAEQITERLKLPVPVLLFPEGTSTDGAQVLRFHSRLIDPATSTGAPITAAAVRYVIDGGVEERELCWYGDEGFVEHLWKVLGAKGFSAQLHFGEPRVYSDRRVAADETHAEITAWREAGTLEAESAMATP
jgi:1-acyl-sn-glycerol-3-phosphate acyltransferase